MEHNLAGNYENIDLPNVALRFKELFVESIQQSLRSNVPVGACLSGGLDSSSVVCTAQTLMDEKLKTFSSMPIEKEANEQEYIDAINEYTGTKSYIVTPTFDEFMKDFDMLVALHDEPFPSPSIYMQYRVMKLAKENNVTILLDGQGGDELLAGYYTYLPRYFGDLKHLHKYRKLMSELWSFRNEYLPFVGRVLRNKTGLWNKSIKGLIKKPIGDIGIDRHFGNVSFVEQLRLDLANSLPKLLHTGDLNAKACGVKIRTPFTYDKLVEYVVSLPITARISNGWTKRILREAMRDILPEKIRLRRTKLGFPAPNKAWAIEMISSRKDEIKQLIQAIEEYIDAVPFEKLMNNIIKHKHNEDIKLFWRILIFGKWRCIHNE